jgi:hypothetical protein
MSKEKNASAFFDIERLFFVPEIPAVLRFLPELSDYKAWMPCE